MPLTQEHIYQAIDELRAIASMGLKYSTNEYDSDRYKRTLSIAFRLLSAVEQRPFEEVSHEFQIDNWLHVSPKAGVETVVLQGKQLLLIKRKDDHRWAIPGGLVEVGETLTAAALRELREEAGIHGKITKLLGIFDSRRWKTPIKAHMNSVIFQVEAEPSVPVAGPEAIDVGFFEEDRLPELSPGHHLRVPFLFKLLRGEVVTPYFDPVDAV